MINCVVPSIAILSMNRNMKTLLCVLFSNESRIRITINTVLGPFQMLNFSCAEPNMQIRPNKELWSLALSSAHEKFDV